MTAIDQSVIADQHLPITTGTETTLHSGFRSVISQSYREDESGISATREIVKTKHSVAIVTFDPRLKSLIMVRQFRLAAQMGTGFGKTCELPAGLIDEGEEPLETAKRELLEETGLKAQSTSFICKFLTTPGMTDEVLHLYYAQVDASELPEEAGLENETEQTFPFLVSLDTALLALDQNAIYNGIVMVGLLQFDRNFERLTGLSR